MRVMVLLAVLTLAACGVDGPPEKPQPAYNDSPVIISGTAEFGIGG